MRDTKKYVEAARRLLGPPRGELTVPACEIDEHAVVRVEEQPETSQGVGPLANPGVWVQAWVWVPDAAAVPAAERPQKKGRSKRGRSK